MKRAAARATASRRSPNTKDACKYRQELTSTGDVHRDRFAEPERDRLRFSSRLSRTPSRPLKVNGVVASEATVKDGSYVVQRPFVLVTKDGAALSETAQAFFDFATSADAVDIISAAGAVAAYKAEE